MRSSPEPAMRASERGLVFDIRRFSTHDGDGLRTTVFLKGCPLRCLWCHNPEGLLAGRRPLWVRARCIGCGSCIQRVRHGGVALCTDGLALRPDAPEAWDDVLDACPTGALALGCARAVCGRCHGGDFAGSRVFPAWRRRDAFRRRTACAAGIRGGAVGEPAGRGRTYGDGDFSLCRLGASVGVLAQRGSRLLRS